MMSQQFTINLSDAAKQRMIKVLESTAECTCMRLAVKKSGCSGYAYDLQPVAEIIPDDTLVDLNAKFKLSIDAHSLEQLNGLYIDYVKEGLQHKFKYINPNQTGQCGCGESFAIK